MIIRGGTGTQKYRSTIVCTTGTGTGTGMGTFTPATAPAPATAPTKDKFIISLITIVQKGFQAL